MYRILKDENIISIPSCKLTCGRYVYSKYLTIYVEKIEKIINFRISLPMKKIHQNEFIEDTIINLLNK